MGAWHWGHWWWTSLRRSMKKGIKQQPATHLWTGDVQGQSSILGNSKHQQREMSRTNRPDTKVVVKNENPFSCKVSAVWAQRLRWFDVLENSYYVYSLSCWEMRRSIPPLYLSVKYEALSKILYLELHLLCSIMETATGQKSRPRYNPELSEL